MCCERWSLARSRALQRRASQEPYIKRRERRPRSERVTTTRAACFCRALAVHSLRTHLVPAPVRERFDARDNARGTGDARRYLLKERLSRWLRWIFFRLIGHNIYTLKVMCKATHTLHRTLRVTYDSLGPSGPLSWRPQLGLWLGHTARRR